MRGILYGVGVGPGDPELMTLKAVRLIKENDIIAVPGAEVRETVAYKIAVQAVPELADKELLPSSKSVSGTHALHVFPSIITVQAPQAPSLQPSFTEVR